MISLKSSVIALGKKRSLEIDLVFVEEDVERKIQLYLIDSDCILSPPKENEECFNLENVCNSHVVISNALKKLGKLMILDRRPNLKLHLSSSNCRDGMKDGNYHLFNGKIKRWAFYNVEQAKNITKQIMDIWKGHWLENDKEAKTIKHELSSLQLEDFLSPDESYEIEITTTRKAKKIIHETV